MYSGNGIEESGYFNRGSQKRKVWYVQHIDPSRLFSLLSRVQESGVRMLSPPVSVPSSVVGSVGNWWSSEPWNCLVVGDTRFYGHRDEPAVTLREGLIRLPMKSSELQEECR